MESAWSPHQFFRLQFARVNSCTTRTQRGPLLLPAAFLARIRTDPPPAKPSGRSRRSPRLPIRYPAFSRLQKRPRCACPAVQALALQAACEAPFVRREAPRKAEFGLHKRVRWGRFTPGHVLASRPGRGFGLGLRSRFVWGCCIGGMLIYCLVILGLNSGFECGLRVHWECVFGFVFHPASLGVVCL